MDERQQRARSGRALNGNEEGDNYLNSPLSS